jgi:hypothetical protein
MGSLIWTERGYASHRRTPPSGRDDRRAVGAQQSPQEIDYGYRGTHVTSVAAKAVTQSYYGSAPAHAY